MASEISSLRVSGSANWAKAWHTLWKQNYHQIGWLAPMTDEYTLNMSKK